MSVVNKKTNGCFGLYAPSTKAKIRPPSKDPEQHWEGTKTAVMISILNNGNGERAILDIHV